MKVFKITSLEFPNQQVYVKTAREAAEVVYTTALSEEDPQQWANLAGNHVVITISIEVTDMDEADYDALEAIEYFGE